MMQREWVAAVRRFNRVVTQRVGALDDAYMARDRPLVQARVLWEIGGSGVEVAVLRTRLDLDSGHLSRVLRTLEHDGLIRVDRDAQDARVRLARLTEEGRKEWAVLDECSDELADSILAPLDPGQQQRLVQAMAQVETLLTASLVTITPRPPGDPVARACLRSYFRELSDRFGEDFGGDLESGALTAGLEEPGTVLLVAARQSEPMGCGAVRFPADRPGEIKRLWVASAARGMGLGRRLLTALEDHARVVGVAAVQLDTNGALTEAISLYHSAGYHEIPPYNDNSDADYWFEKTLSDAARPTG